MLQKWKPLELQWDCTCFPFLGRRCHCLPYVAAHPTLLPAATTVAEIVVVPSFGICLSYPDRGVFDVLRFFSLLHYYKEEKRDSVTLKLQDLQIQGQSNLLVKATRVGSKTALSQTVQFVEATQLANAPV